MQQPALTNWPHTWSNYQWLLMMICIIIDSHWLLYQKNHSFNQWCNVWIRWLVIWLLKRLLEQLLRQSLEQLGSGDFQASALANFCTRLRWLIYTCNFIWLLYYLSGSCFICSNLSCLALVTSSAAWAKFSIFLRTYVCRKWVVTIFWLVFSLFPTSTNNCENELKYRFF